MNYLKRKQRQTEGEVPEKVECIAHVKLLIDLAEKNSVPQESRKKLIKFWEDNPNGDDNDIDYERLMRCCKNPELYLLLDEHYYDEDGNSAIEILAEYGNPKFIADVLDRTITLGNGSFNSPNQIMLCVFADFILRRESTTDLCKAYLRVFGQKAAENLSLCGDSAKSFLYILRWIGDEVKASQDEIYVIEAFFECCKEWFYQPESIDCSKFDAAGLVLFILKDEAPIDIHYGHAKGMVRMLRYCCQSSDEDILYHLDEWEFCKLLKHSILKEVKGALIYKIDENKNKPVF